MKVYRGKRDDKGTCRVTVLSIYPSGYQCIKPLEGAFNWGVDGFCSSLLAERILEDMTGLADVPPAWVKLFNRHFLHKLPEKCWKLRAEVIEYWLVFAWKIERKPHQRYDLVVNYLLTAN